jgi:uncharacterized protein (DUF169 family)
MDERNTVPDLKYLNTLLVDKFRVKRRPVAITLCREGPPPGYETANIVACSVVGAAEGGRKVYIDAANHDCWVGRRHNRLEAGEMFVSIPRHHFGYIVELIENFSIGPKKMREVIMPSYAAKVAARAAEAPD